MLTQRASIPYLAGRALRLASAPRLVRVHDRSFNPLSGGEGVETGLGSASMAWRPWRFNPLSGGEGVETTAAGYASAAERYASIPYLAGRALRP